MSRRGKIVMWLAIAVGVVIVAISVIGMIQRVAFDSHQMLEHPFLGVGLLAGAVVLALEILAGRAFITNDKPTWRAFATALPLALFCGVTTFWLVLFGFIPAINSWFDDSPAQSQRVEVVGFGSGKSRDMLYIAHDGGKRGLNAPDHVLELRPKHVIVKTRAGFLGFEWVESIAAVPK
jgi:hypothetical protein